METLTALQSNSAATERNNYLRKKKIYLNKRAYPWHLSTSDGISNCLATTKNVLPSCIELSSSLLSLGGQDVYLTFFEFPVYDFFTKNSKLYTSKIRLDKKEDQQCHLNSARLYMDNPDQYKIITGFSLVSNEWLRHTWLQDKTESIIETTIEREKYFGAELKNDMWEKLYFLTNFLDDNYLNTLSVPEWSKIIGGEVLDFIIKYIDDMPLIKDKTMKELLLKYNDGKKYLIPLPNKMFN